MIPDIGRSAQFIEERDRTPRPRDTSRMPAPPEEREPAPSPGDGAPPVNPSIDFTDLTEQLRAYGLILPDPVAAPADLPPKASLNLFKMSDDDRKTLFGKVASGEASWGSLIDGAQGLTVAPPDPISPDEAQEELDDREAEEQAAHDAGESEPGAKPTWGELFASDEADRRYRLDFLDRVSGITLNHIKPVETPENDIVWKQATVSDRLDKKLNGFLETLLDSGTAVAREIGKEVGDNA